MTSELPTSTARPSLCAAPSSALTPFAAKMLAALHHLTTECEPHPCGGFTTDDMQWRMGTAFTPDETLWATLDELTAARLIRHCGNDDDDAIGSCYELLVSVFNLTPDQAQQMFGPEGIRNEGAQRAWLEDRSTKSLVVVDDPYRVTGRRLVVMQPCQFNARQLANILAEMQ